MSERRGLVVDTNVVMDAVKKDGASDVDTIELAGAREVGAQLLVKYILVYSTKVQQEWIAKGLVPSNRLLSDLARLDRLKLVTPQALRRAESQTCGKYVDHDDQPFVLAAREIERAPRVLVTRDPKTTRPDSRAYVKRTFSVTVKTASEFRKGE